MADHDPLTRITAALATPAARAQRNATTSEPDQGELPVTDAIATAVETAVDLVEKEGRVPTVRAVQTALRAAGHGAGSNTAQRAIWLVQGRAVPVAGRAAGRPTYAARIAELEAENAELRDRLARAEGEVVGLRAALDALGHKL